MKLDAEGINKAKSFLKYLERAHFKEITAGETVVISGLFRWFAKGITDSEEEISKKSIKITKPTKKKTKTKVKGKDK